MGFDPLDFVIFEDVTGGDADGNGDWRDEYYFNEHDLDPDDYDSEAEFLEAMEEAGAEAEEAEEDEKDEEEDNWDDDEEDDEDDDW
jgi:hypothetical protein